jgi:DNA (cytosine-5)-methyltransferase 1
MNECSFNNFSSDRKNDAMSGTITHGSLFSGIGGFDLAAELMGWENVFHCEWNDFGKKILKYYWPNSISYDDITKTDFTIHNGRIDILTGGFPCQPYSAAGKRRGKEDERHLWPEMLRAIREIQPTWIVGENVSGIISWNGGLVFNEVQVDLENEGYKVQPVILPAAGINAPHRRDRVWFIAYSASNGHERGISNSERYSNWEQGNQGIRERFQHKVSANVINGITANSCSNGHESRGFGEDRSSTSESKTEQKERERIWSDNRGISKQGITANTNSIRRERGQIRFESKKRAQPNDEQFKRCDKFLRQEWEKFPTQSPVCSGDDGISTRLDGITFPKWRNESIKGYGNAIVPQVAYQIFKALMITEKKEREGKIIKTDLQNQI